jgi:hypothetical protein
MVCATESGIPRSWKTGQQLSSVTHDLGNLTRETVIAHQPNLKAPYCNAMCCNKVDDHKIVWELAARV